MYFTSAMGLFPGENQLGVAKTKGKYSYGDHLFQGLLYANNIDKNNIDKTMLYQFSRAKRCVIWIWPS